MPSPAALLEALWESRTPSNARELESQLTLIRDRLQGHQDSSPTSVLQSLDRLTRGAETMAHELVLLRDQVSTLQKANEAAIKRRARKKKRLQKQGTLTKAQGADIIAEKEAGQHLESKRRQDAARLGVSRQAVARCKRCREPGHNSRTCKKDTVDTA